MGKHNEEFPAQPDNLALTQAANMLDRSAQSVLYVMRALRSGPNKAKRSALKRTLSGVLADVETVRIAIKE